MGMLPECSAPPRLGMLLECWAPPRMRGLPEHWVLPRPPALPENAGHGRGCWGVLDSSCAVGLCRRLLHFAGRFGFRLAFLGAGIVQAPPRIEALLQPILDQL